MSKSYNKLWVFGDSYTTPEYYVRSVDSFWGLTAQAANISEVKNCSWLGSSFDSVCHMLISMQDQYDWDNDLFIVTMPPLERHTVFDNYKDTRYYGFDVDANSWKSTKFSIECHTGLEVIHGHEAQNMVIYYDRSWLETQVLSKLFLLTTWLDSKNANYVVVNLGKNLDENNSWGPSSFVLPWALQQERCILFKDSYYHINLDINKPADYAKHGWHGHHGAAGNRYFFEKSLLPTLKRNSIC